MRGCGRRETLRSGQENRHHGTQWGDGDDHLAVDAFLIQRRLARQALDRPIHAATGCDLGQELVQVGVFLLVGLLAGMRDYVCLVRSHEVFLRG